MSQSTRHRQSPTDTVDKVLEDQMKAKGWKWTRLGPRLFIASYTAPSEILAAVQVFYPKAKLNESQLPDVVVIKIGRAK